MECHEGATMIKTFRGLMEDGAQDTIVLHSNDGSTGYRVVKFQILTERPGIAGYESIVQIWKVRQTTVPTSSGSIDFSDNTLLAAATVFSNNSQGYGPFTPASIFDREIFNQDIYITHTNNEGSDACNYYLELEQFALALDENTVATLKDIRNTARSIV